MKRIVMSVSAFAMAWAAVVLSGQQPAAPAGQAQGQGAGRGPAAPPPPMSFFITSVGLGRGGDLGGLAGADAHC
jgi:hypothetical protein